MDNLADRLNCRIDVYGANECENILQEKDLEYSKIKTVWANIALQGDRTPGGNLKKWQGNTVVVEVSHKFTIRAGAIQPITCDMYFMYKGQRYDIKYFNPNYALKDRIEVYCMLRVE